LEGSTWARMTCNYLKLKVMTLNPFMQLLIWTVTQLKHKLVRISMLYIDETVADHGRQREKGWIPTVWVKEYFFE
jgi:hypothetical protein